MQAHMHAQAHMNTQVYTDTYTHTHKRRPRLPAGCRQPGCNPLREGAVPWAAQAPAAAPAWHR